MKILLFFPGYSGLDILVHLSSASSMHKVFISLIITYNRIFFLSIFLFPILPSISICVATLTAFSSTTSVYSLSSCPLNRALTYSFRILPFLVPLVRPLKDILFSATLVFCSLNWTQSIYTNNFSEQPDDNN